MKRDELMVDITVYVLGAIATISLALFGVLYAEHKILAIWIMFACIVLYAFAACLFWQQRVRPNTRKVTPGIAMPSQAPAKAIEEDLNLRHRRASKGADVRTAPTKQASVVNSAPNGIAISGGIVNNPTVNNFAPKPGRIVAQQNGDTITFYAEGGSVEPVSVAFVFDNDVDLIGRPKTGIAFGLQTGTLSDPELAKRSVLIQWANPALRPGVPVTFSFSSPGPARLVGVVTVPYP